MPKLVFDHRLFHHINEAAVKEHGRASKVLLLVEKLLRQPLVVYPLAALEHLVGFLLTLPIPLYKSLVYQVVTHMPGLPYFAGMYVRALYYRRMLGRMDANVFIDQEVFFAYPKGIELSEFSYIDKGVLIMARSARVGRRVHIAPRVFISGGGEFEIEDYACVAANSTVITSTEVLKDGARCSGPMVKAGQRHVLRGKVLIKKDAFIGANATILPEVVVAEGSVAAAGVTLTRSTEPWGIYLGMKAEKKAERAPVVWPDDPHDEML